jgi:YVTN family beta-propeller protein
VFAFNGHSDNVSVLDAQTNKIVKNIPLPGNPEFSVTDHKGHVYVNIEHASKLSRINSETLQLEKTWSIAPGSEPSGLAADFDLGKLFLVCVNKRMIVFDLNLEKVEAEVPIGQGTDGAAFDTRLKRAYSSNGEGTLSVVEVKGDKIQLLETFKTMRGGRTICLDPKTHHLFVPTAKYNPPKPGEKRGQRVPDSFVILEIAPKL